MYITPIGTYDILLFVLFLQIVNGKCIVLTGNDKLHYGTL